MKRKRFSEEQIVRIVTEIEAGSTSGETARRRGFAMTTLFLPWIGSSACSLSRSPPRFMEASLVGHPVPAEGAVRAPGHDR